VLWPSGSVLGVDDGSAFLPLHGGVGSRLHDLSQVGDVAVGDPFGITNFVG